jgi:hypothetical protein
MINNPYGYMPQFQPVVAPPVQRMQQPVVEQQTPQLQPNVVNIVGSMQEAQNAAISMDGNIFYFLFGDTILARKWQFSNGKIENAIYKIVPTDQQEVAEPVDRLKTIEDKLDTLITQSKYPINKYKGTKDAE